LWNLLSVRIFDKNKTSTFVFCKSTIMKYLTAMLCLIILINETNAQSGLPVKKISIFKNNTAMIIKEGAAPVRSGKVSIPVPSHAIYGTYFLGTGKDNPVKNLSIKNDTVKKQEKAIEVWQLVAGNIGKKVTISFSPAQQIDKAISGKILDYNQQSNMLRIQQDNGKITAINAATLYMAEFAEEESRTYMADSIQRSLILSAQNGADNMTLQEVYLQSGINWIPSYFMILKGDKTAHLEMKATIENFADPISNAETELIVGAPQMTYSGKPDPMTYDYQTLDGAADASQQGYAMSNAMQARGNFAFAAAAAPAYDKSFATEGEKTDDMYIYKIGKVTLDRNSKGIYPIFGGTIEYKDKYKGTIPDKSNYFYNHAPDADETPIDVYHSLEVKNSNGVPLTTAPVTIINDKDQFVAQDQIKYTPAGGSCDIRLSKAIDIIMKNTEDELTRTDNARKVGKVNYSLTKLKGTVTLENYQDKEVTVYVTKEMSGDVTAASDAGKIIKPKGRATINPYTQIKWEVKLSPNEKKSLSYEYDVLFTP